MAKNKLADSEMSDVAIHELRGKHRELIARRSQCPGDSERAMYSLQQEFGLGYWPQWNFLFKRYRKPPEKFLLHLRQVILLEASKSVRKELARLEMEAAKGNAQPDLDDLRTEVETVLAKVTKAMGEKVA